MAKSTIADGMVTRVSILIIGAIVARIGSYQMAVYSVGMHLMNINQALGSGLQTSGVTMDKATDYAEKVKNDIAGKVNDRQNTDY